jgi:hypothetical protein
MPHSRWGTQKRAGMLLTNGSRLTLSNFSISIGAHGRVSSPLTPLVSLDMSPHRLEAALASGAAQEAVYQAAESLAATTLSQRALVLASRLRKDREAKS